MNSINEENILRVNKIKLSGDKYAYIICVSNTLKTIAALCVTSSDDIHLVNAVYTDEEEFKDTKVRYEDYITGDVIIPNVSFNSFLPTEYINLSKGEYNGIGKYPDELLEPIDLKEEK